MWTDSTPEPWVYGLLQAWLLAHGAVYLRHHAPRRWPWLLLGQAVLQTVLSLPVALSAPPATQLVGWSVTLLVTAYLLLADLIRVVSRVVRRTQHRDKSTSRRYAHGAPALPEAGHAEPALAPVSRPQRLGRRARAQFQRLVAYRRQGERRPRPGRQQVRQFYQRLAEANTPTVERVTVSVPRLPALFEGLRVVQLTDFHAGEHLTAERLAESVTWANSVAPDLIVLTGDFVTNTREAIGPCAAALSELRAPLGVWACLGNHDFWTDPDGVAEALTAVGIEVLRNRHVRLERGGEVLYLAGIDDIWLGADDLPGSLAGIPTGAPVVLLAHNPDVLPRAEAFGVDLMLSGHTHGGQIRVPLLGPIGIPTQLGKYYVAGLHRSGETALYISRGIGVVGLPLRLNCPPELTLLQLTRQTVEPAAWPEAWRQSWEALKQRGGPKALLPRSRRRTLPPNRPGAGA